MIVIASSPLLSYLSYEIMASDGWLEGFFTGSQSTHGRMEEGFISHDSVLEAIRITSFSRVAVYSNAANGLGSVPSGAIGWFRYRNKTAKRLSFREMSSQLKFARDVPNFVFCLATREMKGDVMQTQALNFSFYTVKPADGPGRKAIIQPVPLMIANPDDAVQPQYPFYQIDHAFSIPWQVPEGNSSEVKHRDSFKRAVTHSLPIEPPQSDPSQMLVDFTKGSYKKMIERLADLSQQLQRHESLIEFE